MRKKKKMKSKRLNFGHVEVRQVQLERQGDRKKKLSNAATIELKLHADKKEPLQMMERKAEMHEQGIQMGLKMKADRFGV
jgi:hypothetical protein